MIPRSNNVLLNGQEKKAFFSFFEKRKESNWCAPKLIRHAIGTSGIDLVKLPQQKETNSL